LDAPQELIPPVAYEQVEKQGEILAIFVNLKIQAMIFESQKLQFDATPFVMYLTNGL
jgi:hypothetical protein